MTKANLDEQVAAYDLEGSRKAMKKAMKFSEFAGVELEPGLATVGGGLGSSDSFCVTYGD